MKAKAKRTHKRVARVTEGSGNVFADLGLPNPEQELLKAQLTLQIYGTLGAHSVIPNRRRGIPEGAFRYQMHRAFPRPLYGPRAKIETVFSVIKRKLSTKAPGRSLPLQMRQALLLGLAFNLYRLKSSPCSCRM